MLSLRIEHVAAVNELLVRDMVQFSVLVKNCADVALKSRPMPPKSNRFLSIYHFCLYASLVQIYILVKELSCNHLKYYIQYIIYTYIVFGQSFIYSMFFARPCKIGQG